MNGIAELIVESAVAKNHQRTAGSSEAWYEHGRITGGASPAATMKKGFAR
jgi:hypothetical protein